MASPVGRKWTARDLAIVVDDDSGRSTAALLVNPQSMRVAQGSQTVAVLVAMPVPKTTLVISNGDNQLLPGLPLPVTSFSISVPNALLEIPATNNAPDGKGILGPVLIVASSPNAPPVTFHLSMNTKF
jgi:hypothetical protein